MSDDYKTFVLEFYQAFDRRNIEQAFEMLAPQFIAHMVGEGRPMELEAFKVFGLEFYTAFSDGQHRFDQVICSENTVVTSGVFFATHVGSFQGLPPTGKQIELSVMHIDRIEQGKIVEHWGYGDVFGLMSQLGIVFVPGPKILPSILKGLALKLARSPTSE